MANAVTKATDYPVVLGVYNKDKGGRDLAMLIFNIDSDGTSASTITTGLIEVVSCFVIQTAGTLYTAGYKWAAAEGVITLTQASPNADSYFQVMVLGYMQ